jgi:hypothetical protein
VVTEVIDKISGGVFVQLLTVQASDYSSGNEKIKNK